MKNYRKPILKKIVFDKEDVITTGGKDGVDTWEGGSGQGADTPIDWRD